MDGSLVLLEFVLLMIFLFILLPVILWGLKRSRRKLEYGVKSVTQRGEEVKSIGERRIADYFEKNKIRYEYEKKARRKSLFSRRVIGIPDFYLPDYGVYIEYWGLVNADDRRTKEEYVRNMKRKMAIYHRNKIKFISIYPDNLENFDWIFRKKFSEVTGLDLPK